MTRNIGPQPRGTTTSTEEGDDDGDMKAGCLGQGALLRGDMRGQETSKSKSKHH